MKIPESVMSEFIKEINAVSFGKITLSVVRRDNKLTYYEIVKAATFHPNENDVNLPINNKEKNKE